ncbi:hypothetical protein G6L09_11575 [Agrobacterium rhizogenes]|nr:hypothetical protein [Rhizobium rhizogenes]NTH71194.1 hypothetical protein [Rhizobium rhizogenes]
MTFSYGLHLLGSHNPIIAKAVATAYPAVALLLASAHSYTALTRTEQLASPHDIAGDEKRQAIDSIRGYVYQIYLSALSWLDISKDEILHLEVAEDFAVSSTSALDASQAKATEKNITLNDQGVKDAINAFFDLKAANPGKVVTVHFLTTSSISPERSLQDRIGGVACLKYWRSAAEVADVKPLRDRILALELSPQSLAAVRDLSEDEFREEFLRRIVWDTDQPGLEDLSEQLLDGLIRLGRQRQISAAAMTKCLAPVVATVLTTCTNRSARQLTADALTALIDESTSISIPIDQHIETQGLLLRLLAERGLESPAPISGQNEIFRPLADKMGQRFLASRAAMQAAIANRLESSHFAWLYAGSGFGKSTLARLTAQQLGGDWKALNVRGLSPPEATELLYSAGQALLHRRIAGVILDDAEHFDDSSFSDALEFFVQSARSASTQVIATSYQRPSQTTLAAVGLGTTTSLQVPELNENDVAEIVTGLGGNASMWARYVHLASGSGHPQLVQALSRNLATREWPFSELENLNALLGGNTEIAKVRQEARKKLIASLQTESLSLLTRLTVVPGKFDREMVFQMSEGDPPIPNAGLVFETLIGPWVDEPYQGVFQVSPLISDLATTTVSEGSRLNWQRRCAIAIVSGKSLDAGKMNAAVMMAMATNEKSVLLKIATATLQLDDEKLAQLSESFFVLQGMSTDRPIIATDEYLNVLLRLAQYLLLRVEKTRTADKLLAVWNALTGEVDAARASGGGELLELMILAKCLSAEDLPFRIPDYFARLSRVYEITSTSAHEEVRALATIRHGLEEMASLGLMFVMHLQTLDKIDDALSLYEEVNLAPQQLIALVTAPLSASEIGAEMYFSAAWLKEHSAGTIDPERHAKAYVRIAELARGWGQNELAVTAIKYAAVIVDEYGKDDVAALELISEARTWAGNAFELARAEAKILYRDNRFLEALPLYKPLMDGGGSESQIENAFMGREGAICAAETGNFILAATWYEAARQSAQQSQLPSMSVMATGLLGDAAVAYWLAGERSRFFDLFTTGLIELEQTSPEVSLTAHHVHALYRHTILWAENELTGNVHIGDGSAPSMLSGSISNPEPSPSTASQVLLNLDLAWYMLAALEVGTGLSPTVKAMLDHRFSKRRLFTGELILTGRMLEFYRKERRIPDFVDMVFAKSMLGVIRKHEILDADLDLSNLPYFEMREPTELEQSDYFANFETLVLTFAIELLASHHYPSVLDLLDLIKDSPHKIRPEFRNALIHTSDQEQPDFNSLFVTKLREASTVGRNLPPDKRLHFHILILQYVYAVTAPGETTQPIAHWMKEEWLAAISAQGFLLKSPGLFGRHLYSSAVSETEPLATAAKIIQIAVAHVPVRVHPDFLSMLSNIVSSQS